MFTSVWPSWLSHTYWPLPGTAAWKILSYPDELQDAHDFVIDDAGTRQHVRLGLQFEDSDAIFQTTE
jgi:hypothetical protein